MLVTAVFLCVCLFLATFPHYCTDLDLAWGNGKGCPPVVHYWADLQSVHGFRCYDNIVPNAKCQQVLVVLNAWLVYVKKLPHFVNTAVNSVCFAFYWQDLRQCKLCVFNLLRERLIFARHVAPI